MQAVLRRFYKLMLKLSLWCYWSWLDLQQIILYFPASVMRLYINVISSEWEVLLRNFSHFFPGPAEVPMMSPNGSIPPIHVPPGYISQVSVCARSPSSDHIISVGSKTSLLEGKKNRFLHFSVCLSCFIFCKSSPLGYLIIASVHWGCSSSCITLSGFLLVNRCLKIFEL